MQVVANENARIESCDLQLGDTWRGMQSKMSVTAPVKKIRKKSENKPQSQINKCHNEKKRRELENEVINQLEELLGACLADVKQPDKNGIVREATRQLQEALNRRRDCPAECPVRRGPCLSPVQGGEVSSTQHSASHDFHFSDISTLIEAVKHYTSVLGLILMEINSRGDIECVTENIKDFILFERTELYKKSLFSLLHPDDHAKFNPLLRTVQTFAWGAADSEKFQNIQARFLCDLSGIENFITSPINLAGTRYLELVESSDRVRVSAHLQEVLTCRGSPAVSEPYRLCIDSDRLRFRVSAQSRLFPTAGEPDFIMSTNIVLGDEDVELVEIPHPLGGPLMTSVANGESSSSADPRYRSPGSPADTDGPFSINDFDLDPWAAPPYAIADISEDSKDRKDPSPEETAAPVTPRAPSTPAEPAAPHTPHPPVQEEPNRLRTLLSKKMDNGPNRILKDLLKQEDEEGAASGEQAGPLTPLTPQAGAAALSPLQYLMTNPMKMAMKAGEAQRIHLLASSNGPSGNGRTPDGNDLYLERIAGMKRKFEEPKTTLTNPKRATPENQQSYIFGNIRVQTVGNNSDNEPPSDKTLSEILDELIDNNDRPAQEHSLMDLERHRNDYQGACTMGGNASAAAMFGLQRDAQSARVRANYERARLLHMQESQQMLVSPEAAEQPQSDLGSTINALVSGTPPNVAVTQLLPSPDFHRLYHPAGQMNASYGTTTNKIVTSQHNPMINMNRQMHIFKLRYIVTFVCIIGGSASAGGAAGAGGVSGGGTSEYVRNELRAVVGARARPDGLALRAADLDALLPYDMAA
ncbi:unnamed protein product, partial [Leptidea sinapis]